jgi:hypothetical protein
MANLTKAPIWFMIKLAGSILSLTSASPHPELSRVVEGPVLSLSKGGAVLPQMSLARVISKRRHEDVTKR